MAKVIVLATHNLRALADLAGSDLKALTFRPDELELDVPDVTQPALDAALVDYTANQAARDATFIQQEIDAETARVKDTFDDNERRLLRAFAETVLDELNNLRAQHGLAARTMAQLRTAIRNKL